MPDYDEIPPQKSVVRKIPANVKFKIRLLAIDNHCAYCQRELTIETATTDHIIPKSRNGSSDASNKTLACYKCNQDKGDLTADEYRRKLASQVAEVGSFKEKRSFRAKVSRMLSGSGWPEN